MIDRLLVCRCQCQSQTACINNLDSFEGYISQTWWSTYSNTLPLWLIIVTIQFDSSIISVAVLFHLLCGSLTQYASQSKHFANISWSFSFQCCFPINFFECLSCKSPCTLYHNVTVIVSRSYEDNFDLSIFNIFPYKLRSYINVLCSAGCGNVLTHEDSTNVVNSTFYWVVHFDLHRFQ